MIIGAVYPEASTPDDTFDFLIKFTRDEFRKLRKVAEEPKRAIRKVLEEVIRSQ